MATSKDVAALAGVSRGTVDRVLNNRGGVKPETAHRVEKIARALNYSPNIVGKTLAIKKKNLFFGIVLFSSTASNPFFLDVVQGIESQAAKIEEYGVSVEIRYASIGDPALQVRLVEELVLAGITGLVIAPINHRLVQEKIRQLVEGGLPVITVNSDIPDCGRLAYVGSNFYQSGQTAAGLMHMVTGGTANIGILMGHPLVLCHSERVAGFSDTIGKEYKGLQILHTAVNHDDDVESFAATTALLKANPATDALYLAAAGVAGACRALQAMGLQGKIKVIANDTTAATRELIQKGSIVATIAQQPFVQGAKPLELLLNYVGLGKRPEREYYYTKSEIIIKENMQEQQEE